MDPVHEENVKPPQTGEEPKRKRFRIVKLEGRIAPGKGGNGTHNGCGATVGCGYTPNCCAYSNATSY